VDRVTEAFVWPARDPQWVAKLVVVGLLTLIPIAGSINALGWMLASLDRLRAGEERLAPANFSHVGRGIRLFVVELVYGLAIAAVALVAYIPGVAIAVQQGRDTANGVLIVLALVLNLAAFGVATIGSLVFTFATPAIVLAADAGGIGGGLNARDVLRRSRANFNNTLIAGLMLIAAGFVSSLGVLICVVGVLFTGTYALAMQAWVVHSFESGSVSQSQAGA
jgi:hypothetical protein